GLVLAPGIVDIHTHYDAQLTWDSFATPSTALGVTTVVIGNCGFTIAPCRPDDRDLTPRNLTHVEGMSLEALRAGVRWEFETYPEFLDASVAAWCPTSRRSSATRRSGPTSWARTRPSARPPTPRSPRCAASSSRRPARAPSASRRPRSSSTTARTAFRCRRGSLTTARCAP